jgi:hypothetical protein
MSLVGQVFLQDDALLVRWAMDGQDRPAHLDFDGDLELDVNDVTRGVFELLRKGAISLAKREGE